MTREGLFGILAALGVIVVGVILFFVVPANGVLPILVIFLTLVGSILAGVGVHGSLTRRRMGLDGDWDGASAGAVAGPLEAMQGRGGDHIGNNTNQFG